MEKQQQQQQQQQQNNDTKKKRKWSSVNYKGPCLRKCPQIWLKLHWY